MNFRQAGKHKKKDSAKGNFARRFLIMFQVAVGKLPADCFFVYLPFFSNENR
ncbi:MAG: hypothetical protein GYA35_03450 [Thermoanaerobaculaceae bacterium]|nr:hypothetical protein [Thermoanaerobaculaceae bacterium]